MLQLLHHLMAIIDSIVYSVASVTFTVIVNLATKVEFFRPEQITKVANRIYVIIGVLMLFKIVLTGLQHLINPDTLDDKEKGIGGLLRRTLISLSLIAVAPTIFDLAYKMQGPIIESIPSIILGVPANSVNSDEIGSNIAFQTLSYFIQVNDKYKDDPNYGVGPDKQIHDFNSFNEHITEGCRLTIIGWIFDNGQACVYDYMIFISTIAGCFMVYVMLSMALDIGIRAIKLGLIQMLAPIPIASYIFSKEKFNKFTKTLLQVYADLFIRLAVVFFIIFAVGEILRTEVLSILGIIGGRGVVHSNSWYYNVVCNNVLINSLLMFAKKAPKFLSELLGIPDIGSGELADMFKPVWQRAPVLAAQAGIGGAFLANAANRISQQGTGKTFGEKLKNTLTNADGKRGAILKDAFKSGAAGAASAGFHGGIAAAQGKTGKEIMNAGYKRAIDARTQRDISRLKGATGLKAWSERMAIKAQDYAGIVTPVSLMESQQKAMSSVASAEKAEIDRTKIILNANKEAINANGSDAMAASLQKMAQSYLKQVKATQTTNAVTGRIEINGVSDIRLKNMMEAIVNKEEVALSTVLSFADYTGGDGELKQISDLLTDDGDYIRNMHKNATEDAYNGGVVQIGGGTFGKLDASKTDEFDTQLKGFHSGLVSAFVDNADSLGEFENSIKKMAEADYQKGRITAAQRDDIITRRASEKSLAEYLDRIYKEHTRMTEAAIDDAVTNINSVFNDPTNPDSARLKRERVIREDIKRRKDNKS